MRARKTRRIERILDELEHGFHVIPFDVDGVNVSLVARWVNGRWYTYFCWMVNPRVTRFYYKRWGVESCIRMFKLFSLGLVLGAVHCATCFS